MLRKLIASAIFVAASLSCALAQPAISQPSSLPLQIPNARAESTLTLSSGAATLTRASHLIAAESGTADTATSFVVSAFQAGNTIKIAPDTGDTITIDAGISDTGSAFDISGDEFAYIHVQSGGAYVVSMGGGSGGSDVTETYDTKTLAAAATWAPTLTVVKTLGYATAGDNGAAEYRVTSCPGALKVWHIQSANGLCATLADKEVALEAFGILTANSAAQNDTALDTLEEALLPASGLGLKKVYAGSVGGTYNWGAYADGSVALNLVNVNGVELDFNNSSWPASFSTTRRIGFIQLTTGSAFNHIHSVNGSQPNYTSTATTGVDWFVETTGAHHNRFQGSFTGGLQGYAAVGSYAAAVSRVYGSKVDIKTKDVYYGMANQSSGDYSDYKVICEGSGRCVIAYNALNNNYDITNLSATAIYTRANQFLFKAYGTAVANVVNEFTGHKVKIRDYAQADSVALSAPIYIQHDQDEINCGSVGTKISIDFDIDFALGTDAERYATLIGNDAYRYVTPGTCGSGKELGEPVTGVNDDRITITGRVTGNLSGSADFASLGLAANGIGSATLSDWSFVNFNALSLTRPFNSGQYNNLSLIGVNAPSASVTFAGTRSARFTAKNSKTTTYGNTDAHYQPTSGGVNINLNGATSSGFNLSAGSTLKADNVVDSSGYYIRGNNGIYLGATTVGGGGGNYGLVVNNADVSPLVDNTVDLGNTTYAWKDLYIDGEIVQDGNSDASISPTWGNDGTANSIGNGTLTGTARKIGNRVFFDISLTFGSTTTVGNSTMYFTLPSPFNGNFATTCAGSVYVSDNGTGFKVGAARMASGAAKIYMVNDGGANFFGSTIPITWATSDVLIVSGSCEL